MSRVGDELQQRSGDPSGVAVDSEGAERVEAQAIEDARRHGWDHDLTDVEAPADGTGPVATADDATSTTVPTDTLDPGDLDAGTDDADIGRGAD
ncbi:MAG: hypothetical protein U0Q07_13220 [Acidimicrobiales bacterium]